MKITAIQFENIMTTLDNDDTVDEKELKLILKKMRSSKNLKEFYDFMKSIAIAD